MGTGREKLLFTKKSLFWFLVEIESHHYTFLKIVVKAKFF